MITSRGTWGSDERPVGPACAVAADGYQTGPAAGVDAAAADRRHTVADPDRCSVAGCARTLRAVGPGLRPVRRWQRNGTWARILTQLQSEADAKGLITWAGNVDSTVCRAHQHAAGAVKRGIFRRSRRRGLRRACRPRTRTLPWRADQQDSPRGRVPPQPVLPAQARGQGHDPGPGGPGPQPAQARLARRAAAEVRQGRLQAAARGRVRDQPPQTPPGPSPPDTTNSPSATKQPSWSQPSTNGCDQHRSNAPQAMSNSLPSGSCMAAA